MRPWTLEPTLDLMTLTSEAARTSTIPPLSRAARVAAALCLITAGLTNGLGQYVGEALMPELDDFSAQIRWGVDHPGIHQAEQTALLVSMLVLPLGLLGLAHVTRWSAPRLTAVGIVLTWWGMWGFHNVVALGYAAGTVGPGAIGTEAAVDLNDGFTEHVGTIVTALVPHLLGSFVGLLLLAVAGLRGHALPKVPLVLLLVFLVWDFLLPAVGLLEPHLLLAVSLVWLGVAMLRMPHSGWLDPGQRGSID